MQKAEKSVTHRRAEGGNGGLETGSGERGQWAGGAAPPLVATATGPGEFPFRLTSCISSAWGPRSSPPPAQREGAAARPSPVLSVGCGAFGIIRGSGAGGILGCCGQRGTEFQLGKRMCVSVWVLAYSQALKPVFGCFAGRKIDDGCNLILVKASVTLEPWSTSLLEGRVNPNQTNVA